MQHNPLYSFTNPHFSTDSVAPLSDLSYFTACQQCNSKHELSSNASYMNRACNDQKLYSLEMQHSTPLRHAIQCPQYPSYPPFPSYPLQPAMLKSQRLIVDICYRLLKTLCCRDSFQVMRYEDVHLTNSLVKILRSSAASYSALLICIIYLVRFKNYVDVECIDLQMLQNPMVLFAVSLVLSLKFVTDRHISNNNWEAICGLLECIPTELFNLAESKFLKVIKYELYVEPQLINNLAGMILTK